jgi:hypothetical protein
MRSIATLAVLCGILASVHGQDSEVKMKLSAPGGKKKTVITQSAKPKTLEEQKQIEFEGFLVGLLSTNKLTKVLDFKAPVDPVKEEERVVVDKNDGRTIGFKLFTIRF